MHTPSKKISPPDTENTPAKDLHDLQHQELSGQEDANSDPLEQSETDEDENEGVGDGNMGGDRRVPD